MKLNRLGVLALAFLAPACYDFHFVGPEEAPVIRIPTTVTVDVVYQRPVGCVNTVAACQGPVTFHASWMPLGSYIFLDETATHVWTARVANVPINFPNGEAYRVYAVDPYLSESPTGGVSADRLTIGDEKIRRIDNPGGTREQGLIYIDANGKGRSPT